jgi:methanethiol S-methyltransferase
MKRLVTFLFSLTCYAISTAALVYLILFVADLFVPVTVNIASPVAPAFSGAVAIVWNCVLIAIWGVQHTGMASLEFKARWTKLVPPAIERSVYLVFVTIMTAGLIAFWIPMPDVIWDVSTSTLGAVLLGVYFLGWMITLISTFLINHFHLFGLQQAWRMDTETQSKTTTFRTPFFYKLVRHPMMTGILISLWAAPELTVGRLVFNTAMTVYILVGVRFEERSLVHDLGEQYQAYRETTPALIPGFPASKSRQTA